jgi:apyrase
MAMRDTRWSSSFLAGAVLALWACAGQPAPQAASPAAATAASPRYALVIDAGSSGSRLHVYQWRPPAPGAVPWVEVAPFPRETDAKPWEKKIAPGISSYAADPAAAGPALQGLVDFAAEKLGGDSRVMAATPLWLEATAGMRLVEEPARGAVLASVRETLAASPFDFRGAEVISGEAEGLFGWISVNYLLGHLQRGGPFPTVGALDLGGASTQIAFLPVDFPRADGAAVHLGSTTYRVYAHSYLGLGQDQAREAVGSPACYPAGYPLPGGEAGSGDYAACREAIRRFLARPCAAAPCSLMGVYQPPLYGEFFAFSGYSYAASFFGLGQSLSLPDLETRTRSFCASTWESILADHPGGAEDPYLPRYCFNGAYVVTLLTDGFGFPMDTRAVVVPRKVQGKEVDWTLGALVYELGGAAD